ncbi:MAG: hypothetical protein ACYSUI_16625 [Planctomycetota bacterium]
MPNDWAPARSDTPKSLRTLRGLPALPGMVLLWFSPRHIGVRLAAAGWRAAIAAHLLGLILGIGVILWHELLPMNNPVPVQQIVPGFAIGRELPVPQASWPEYLRGPFAAIAVILHAGSGPGGNIATLILLLAGLETAVVVLAVALMPFAAAGEPAGGLFGRCVRLTWWSTTMLIPLGIGWVLESRWQRVLGVPGWWDPVDYAALSLLAVWWLTVWLRSGYRYAGPPDGPAWQPRIPRCEKCGYEIVGLPTSTNCPECAQPVVDSLPDRRSPPAFALAKSPTGAIRAFWPTVRAAASDRTFFDRLAVSRGHTKARTFLLTTGVLNAAIVLLGTVTMQRVFMDESASIDLAAYGVVASCCWLVGQVLVAGLLSATLAIISRRQVQPVAVGVSYALCCTLAITSGAVVLVLSCGLVGPAMDISTTWAEYMLAGLFLSLGPACFVVGVILTIRCVLRMLRQSRFANA